MSLLGLDVGTTGTKAVAFNLEGGILASAYREYPLYTPRPGWQELDPEEVWGCVREALGEVAGKTSHDPIQSLAVSAQGEACVLIARDGSCLTRSPVTFDGRTGGMPAWWLERISRLELAQITGMPLHGMYTLNKVLWWKENEPETFAKAWKVLCYEDFVHHRLGVTPTMSHSLAGRTMALDVKNGQWSRQVLDIAGIDPDLFADTAPSGQAIGVIPDSVADDIGLPRNVVVATGGHDQPAGSLGAGVTSSGEAMYASGTVECIAPVFDAFTITPETVENNLCCYPSCLEGLYSSISFNFTGGSLLKWYRDTFAGEEKREADKTDKDVYDLICAQIPEAPENLLILPHFTMTGTPHFDTNSRGAILGLTLETSRGEVVSAILSGVVYEMKVNLSLLQSAGVPIQLIKAVGGGAKSPVWVQRKADILGVPVGVLETTEAAAFGVAMLGGKAVGAVHDLREAISGLVKVKDVRQPDPGKQAAYEERFELYKELYPALKRINHGLAALQED